MHCRLVCPQIVFVPIDNVTNITFEYDILCGLDGQRRHRSRLLLWLRYQTLVLLHLLHGDVVRSEHVHFQPLVIAELGRAHFALDEHTVADLMLFPHVPFVRVFSMNTLLTNSTAQSIVHIVHLADLARDNNRSSSDRKFDWNFVHLPHVDDH